MSKNNVNKLTISELISVIKKTFIEFFQEQSFFHGAALAYYGIFALVPTMYLALLSFGQFVGQDAILVMIDKLLKEQVGLQDSAAILDFLRNGNFEKSSLVMNIVGVFALLLSSSALLSSLRTSINEFYDIQISIADRKKRIKHTIGSKLLSIILLPMFTSVIMIMYFGETFLMSIGHQLFEDPNGVEQLVLSGALTVFSIAMNGLLFTLVFKFVHDGFVTFRTAFVGGLITAFLLLFGQLIIKYYLQNYFFGSKAGVAGTILVLLVWMYYTSQIIFVGAKFTKVYAADLGTPILFKGRKKRKPKVSEVVSAD